MRTCGVGMTKAWFDSSLCSGVRTILLCIKHATHGLRDFIRFSDEVSGMGIEESARVRTIKLLFELVHTSCLAFLL